MAEPLAAAVHAVARGGDAGSADATPATSACSAAARWG